MHDALQNGDASRGVDNCAAGRYVNVEVSLPRSMNSTNKVPIADFNVLIAGGGTGGHLFPGIAVAEELRRRVRDVGVSFVGTERGIESRVLPKLGERLDALFKKAG